MIEKLQRSDHRRIIKRIIIRGNLILDTPTCLGSGDMEAPTDLALLQDSISDRALLTGSSLAGALRNYLHEYEQGYGKNEIRQGLATKLFGHLFRYEGEELKEEENQSSLIIDDAISSKIPVIELRDGVKIDGATGTGEDGAKYDLELLEAGTEFFLSFELLIEKDETDLKIEKDEADLKKALALALRGLEKGEICLGMKKSRGFGRCHVERWQIWEFDLQKPKDRIEWLKFDHWTRELSNKRKSFESIVVALGGVPLKQVIDRRALLSIQAEFKLASPLLIRSGQDLVENKRSPDVVHLHSQRNGKSHPIVSGTSLAGVLWHRAERIVNTLGKDLQIVYNLFGIVERNQAKASRLIIQESIIENTSELVQSRIAIDRFTGGTYHGALFSEQPIFGLERTEEENKSKNKKTQHKNKHIQLKLELRDPKECEIGLLLLLIKDLWTGDVPVGGTSSIGRGRLQGVEAMIIWQQPEKLEQKWVISQDDGKLKFDGKDKQKLENCVREFVEKTP